MRNSSPGDGADQEEEFYESLDRILSSSCSSTSASDDDSDRRHPRISLPLSSAYDVWASQPSSVEERRRRLLQQLGLIGDPSLSRHGSSSPWDDGGGAPPCDVHQGDTGRSVSCDGLCRPNPESPLPVMLRSRSDSCVDSNPHPKPPLAKSASSGTNNTIDDGDEDSDTCGDANGTCHTHCEDEYCTIKNLDSGVQFVVKEVGEDGMWNKLREVGTGRQLTMEEFQSSIIGMSPIVEELMRRQKNEESFNGHAWRRDGCRSNGTDGGSATRYKKRGSWLRSIRNMTGTAVQKGDRRSSDERDTSSEKGGRRSSSATDDSQEVRSHQGSERVKVRHYGRSWKELTGLYLNQEIQAHSGSIWSIRFSSDGRYLASAGEDCVIHVWQVVEIARKRDMLSEKGFGGIENGILPNQFTMAAYVSPEPTMTLPISEGNNNLEKKRRSRSHGSRKSFSLDHAVFPESMLALSEKPFCSFYGHHKDVLDLSWSKSEHLLSSSMDKTVKLWDMSSNACLKTFSHSDYVTCIQFNPIDDNYFLSGSLDAKVRIWSIKTRQVVDWNDLHEMVTAASYTPDGQGALVGSHKGTCNVYNTSDNKLERKCQVNLQNKKKKSHLKKITGFQFAPRSTSEVLITSADSRIRVIDDLELVHKFKGYRNTTSQISASVTADGKHIVCASEDSQVYVWRYDTDSRPNRSKGSVTVTQSYEYFHCHDVSVAVAWPGTSTSGIPGAHDGLTTQYSSALGEATLGQQKLPPQNRSFSTGNGNYFCDRVSATWPEEKLVATANKHSPQNSGELSHQAQSRSAWGMAFVTAGRGGEIKTFQNFGHPVRV